MFKKLGKKGVFGLTAVQAFFAIILGIALLAYIIVVIMGVLGGTTILPVASYTTVNESNAAPNTAGITLACANRTRCTCGTITALWNATYQINSANYTQTNCLITNTTGVIGLYGATLNYSYPYTATSTYQNNQDTILTNTSTGVSGFFSSINPVYAILAVLIIILVLVVLVRVVQAPSGGRQEQL